MLRFTATWRLVGLLLAIGAFTAAAVAEEDRLHSFQRIALTESYFSEGAGAGDINGDGVPDVVYGPYWFAGPDFKTKYEIDVATPQDVNKYADKFFSWVYDFNGDGANDVMMVGLPGSSAVIYENPGKDGLDAHWKRHRVFDGVNNESPQLVNLVGDEGPELVCTHDGFFGFVAMDRDDPFGAWTFHAVSENTGAGRFGHGLGVGDVNGDGRPDILHPQGWLEQPREVPEKSRWRNHAISFCAGPGGADMYAYDVDGDGDNDVITSHSAHAFGLGWYEQVRSGNDVAFKHHLIMGSRPIENRYGVVFSELHAVGLVDMDGDGLKDIVTGKTYWSHHRQAPQWDAGAVVYWFKLVRGEQGIDWIPYQADGEAGIGRQITIQDLNGDELPEIIVGGMKGGHVLMHSAKAVSPQQWQAAQPKPLNADSSAASSAANNLRGAKAVLDEDGRMAGAIEGESLSGRPTSGQVGVQAMGGFKSDRWSGNAQLFWTGGKPKGKLAVELPEFSGTIDLEVVLTCAKDYGIVQLWLDDQKLGEPIDLYENNVVTTGVLRFPKIAAKGNRHTLHVEIIGANPQAVQAYMFGLDAVRIVPRDGDAGEK
ncbi:VCBS repeat-containing protein [Blastopirellula sp. JC732]|uniref:VCBS repeat-containing protein n=1 Tax=Blastopirellula sediminis TaxID=2894196 RepID=A0A9X1ML21_9BACT|nr:VCBS repeat-containing protein [Blastopirellula sediminis]MCC9608961.1 VCBS repeat-containing protein [Blastopirellula sediminis]MCC9628262.1 VCBS repeat-containing protein [Blastopirellula sediminis]